MKYLMILCLLTVFVNRSKAYDLQDSSNVFTQHELKDNSQLLSELEYRRSADSIDSKIIDSLVQSLNDYKFLYGGAKSVIELKDEQNEILKKQIEVVRPAWYDNFAVGSAVTAAILAVIFLLIGN